MAPPPQFTIFEAATGLGHLRLLESIDLDLVVARDVLAMEPKAD